MSGADAYDDPHRPIIVGEIPDVVAEVAGVVETIAVAAIKMGGSDLGMLQLWVQFW